MENVFDVLKERGFIEQTTGDEAIYELLNEPKVMASCIDWNASNESGVYVHNVFTYYTGITSDRPIFSSELARSAMTWCKKWKKAEKIDCTCQMLDKNGKNVLKAKTRN